MGVILTTYWDDPSIQLYNSAARGSSKTSRAFCHCEAEEPQVLGILGRRNPVNSPVEVGSLSHYLQGLTYIPGGAFSRRISEVLMVQKSGEKSSCYLLPSLKTNSKFAPENRWLEDDPFLSGRPSSFRECKPYEKRDALPETNIAPGNEWLEYYFPFGEAYFQGRTVSFRVFSIFNCRIPSINS